MAISAACIVLKELAARRRNFSHLFGRIRKLKMWKKYHRFQIPTTQKG